jgi:hypothetical protein
MVLRFHTFPCWSHEHARLHGARATMSPGNGLNDIEAQIAALEAQLGGIDSDTEGGSDTGSGSPGDADSGRRRRRTTVVDKSSKKEKKAKKEKKRTKEKKRARDTESHDSDSESLEPIAALPAHLLPEHAGYSGKTGKRRKTKTHNVGFVAKATAAMAGAGKEAPDDSGVTIDPFAKQVGVTQPPPIMAILARRKNLPRCDVCQKNYTSQAQLEEHKKGKQHWRAARNAAAAAAGVSVQIGREGSRGLSLGSDAGRGGDAAGGGAAGRGGIGVQGGRGAAGANGDATHVSKNVSTNANASHHEKPPDAPHCALCRKTFTSALQLVEHQGGKWHKQRIAGTLAPSRKPYNES